MLSKAHVWAIQESIQSPKLQCYGFLNPSTCSSSDSLFHTVSCLLGCQTSISLEQGLEGLTFSVPCFLQLIAPEASYKITENTPDDPRQRKPDITKATKLLGWAPTVSIKSSLPTCPRVEPTLSSYVIVFIPQRLGNLKIQDKWFAYAVNVFQVSLHQGLPLMAADFAERLGVERKTD